ncbi:MAG: hypothetical protein C0442_06865 [Chlorobiaceae bacterium]|nr:hypothetical protein [Chlorobiaceae bacterium]
MEGLLTMSRKEADRLEIIGQIESKTVTVEAGSTLMRISPRQTYRVLKKIKEEGTRGLIHKLRGKKSNRSYPEKLKKEVVKIYREQYLDYGATLFSDELVKSHRICVNHQTLRKWLRAETITTSMRKKRPHRKKRERHSCFGELLQFDGSHHDWFEGRGAECCLINYTEKHLHRQTECL